MITNECEKKAKKYPISFSIDADMHKALSQQAASKGEKVSDFIKKIVTSFNFSEENDSNKRAVLVIPHEVLASREVFRNWLDENLVNGMFPSCN